MADLTEPMTADPAKHRDQLFERLDSLRRKETFCDVTVAVNGKEFKAYKVVLAAASPFFLSLFGKRHEGKKRATDRNQA